MVLPMSMTGYGRAERLVEGRRYLFELKSVNHRFLELSIKVPREFSAWEELLRQELQARVARGRVDLYLTVTESEETTTVVKVDKNLVVAYDSALRELARQLHLPEETFLGRILDLPDVVKVIALETDLEKVWPAVREAFQEALDLLLSMRAREGEYLAGDLRDRNQRLKDLVDKIAQRAPAVVVDYRRRLEERLQELQPGGIDPVRLAQEVAIMADRCDISEELVRFRSHLNQFAETLMRPEPIGRKLDFLVQEMNREINTIGSKAMDLTIGSLVIEAKGELEKMREQIQNLE